jgi:hypothetical protein
MTAAFARSSLYKNRIVSRFNRTRFGAPSHGLSPRLRRRIVAGQTGKLEVGRSCPLWVKSRHRRPANTCPLYPQKQTLRCANAMSALCQKRTYAVRRNTSLFDNFVGGRENPERIIVVAAGAATATFLGLYFLIRGRAAQ